MCDDAHMRALMQFIGRKRCRFTTPGVNRSKKLLSGGVRCRHGDDFDEQISRGTGQVAGFAADRQRVKLR